MSYLLIAYPISGRTLYYGPFATAELARYYAEGNWYNYDIKKMERVS